jgi:S1-C subfamily serine protease
MEYFNRRCCQIVVKHVQNTCTMPHLKQLPSNKSISKGSGFIIQDDDSGKKYVVTNFHVIKEYRSIHLKFPLNDEQINADVVFVDPNYDLAFLNFKDIQNFDHIELGTSLEITEDSTLYAVGYPLGLDDIQIQQGEQTGYRVTPKEIYIQHSCSLNHGNSGGPLLVKNKRFEYKCIGINNAIIENANSIDFSIPIERLLSCLNVNKRVGNVLVNPPFKVGLEFQVLNETLKKSMLSPKLNKIKGIRVKRVFKKSIAHGVFELNDIIVNINGLDLSDTGKLLIPTRNTSVGFDVYLSYEDIGEYVECDVIRDGCEKITVEMQIQYHNPFQIRRYYMPFERVDYEMISGMLLTNITDNAIEEFSIKNITDKSKHQGLVIVNVLAQGDVYHSQNDIAKPGTVIVGVNDQEINSLFELRRLMQKDSWGLLVFHTRENDKIVVSREAYDEDNEILANSFSKDVVCRYKTQAKDASDESNIQIKKILDEMEVNELDEIEKLILKQAGLSI